MWYRWIEYVKKARHGGGQYFLIRLVLPPVLSCWCLPILLVTIINWWIQAVLLSMLLPTISQVQAAVLWKSKSFWGVLAYRTCSAHGKTSKETLVFWVSAKQVICKNAMFSGSQPSKLYAKMFKEAKIMKQRLCWKRSNWKVLIWIKHTWLEALLCLRFTAMQCVWKLGIING